MHRCLTTILAFRCLSHIFVFSRLSCDYCPPSISRFLVCFSTIVTSTITSTMTSTVAPPPFSHFTSLALDDGVKAFLSRMCGHFWVKEGIFHKIDVGRTIKSCVMLSLYVLFVVDDCVVVLLCSTLMIELL